MDSFRRTVRRLRRKALVVVVVADEDEVGAVLVQGLPERTDELEIGFSGVGPRREERMVPVRERALGLARRELRAEPLLLLGTRSTGDHLAVAVQDKDLPA